MNPARRLALFSRTGPELAPALVAASWGVSGNDATHVATFAGSTLRYQSDTTSPQLQVSPAQAILTVGIRYVVTVNVTAYTSGSIKTDAFVGASLASGLGQFRFIGTAVNTLFNITRNTTNVDLTLGSVSVRPYHGT